MSAGKYGPTAMVSPRGHLLPSTSVNVYYTGTSTLATLYTSVTKASTTANPLSTDALGNLTFFAEPGVYDVALVSGGSPITVEVDPYAGDIQQSFVFSATGPLVVQTGASRMYCDLDLTIIDIRASVGTAPTGSSVLVDINKNGVTLCTNQALRPQIAIGSFTNIATPSITTLSPNDYLTVDIDQVGSTIAGSDLVVTVRVKPS